MVQGFVGTRHNCPRTFINIHIVPIHVKVDGTLGVTRTPVLLLPDMNTVNQFVCQTKHFPRHTVTFVQDNLIVTSVHEAMQIHAVPAVDALIVISGVPDLCRPLLEYGNLLPL